MTLTASVSTAVLELNSKIKNDVLAGLTDLSPADLASVSGLLANTITDTSELEASISPLSTTLQEKIDKGGKSLAEVQSDLESIAEKPSSPFVQDGPIAFKTAEMPVISSKYASVVELPIASNALREDYPNTSGKIDEAMNWFKVNKTTGYTEFVHNSGSSLKIDKAGNVSVHITGTLKWIVDNDMLLNALKNMDIHSVGNTSLASSNMDIEVSGTLTSSAIQNTHTGTSAIVGAVTVDKLNVN